MSRMVAIDIGNQAIKICEAGQVYSVESIHAMVQPAQSGDQVLEYMDGPVAGLVGKRWVVGSKARHFRSVVRTWEQPQKSLIAPQFLLGALNWKRARNVDLSLYMSLPNPHLEAEQLREILLGKHVIKRGGLQTSITISMIEMFPEGMGGYYEARRQRLVVPNSITGMVDFGGGTSIGFFVDEEGELIQQSRLVLNREGLFGLGTRLAGDHRLQEMAGGTPRIDLIIKGIREGTYAYGSRGSFAEFFEEYRDQWLHKVMSQMFNAWNPWIDEVSRIVAIGGAAPLAESWAEGSHGLFQIIKRSQFVNVVGILPQDDALEAA